MRKYIDADKLIAEIKGIVADVQVKERPDVFGSLEQCLAASEIEALNLVIETINELQQEQPESELEKAAQHVYESWMGGTMDDVRRDMVELGKVLNARKP